MNQLLIPWPVSHKEDNLASVKAGESYHKRGKAASDRERIVSVLPTSPTDALTHRQIADRTGMDYISVARRTKEIESLGLCERISDGLMKCWRKK